MAVKPIKRKVEEPMKSSVKILITILLILDLALAALVFGPFDLSDGKLRLGKPQAETVQAETLPPVTQAPTVITLPPETEPTVPPTTEATEPPTTAATEPEQNTFVLTFVGDCTLGTSPGTWNAAPGFIKTVGSNLTYPWKNVAGYFQADDFSLINLEGPFADGGTPVNGKTSYRCPTEYIAMLTDNKIEAVTLANDHIHDYGDEGYASTLSTLSDAGVYYTENKTSTLIPTDSGLVVGVYAVQQNDADKDAMAAAIEELKTKGAELIIVAPHWGIPGSHAVTDTQKELAHAAIDAGASIVVGTGPHVLQSIEEYEGGIIYYSLGRFVFGGSSISKEWDTVLIQQEVIRNADGTFSLGNMTAIPASMGTRGGIFNYQPTLYQPDVNPKHQESYDRVMEDLNLK